MTAPHTFDSLYRLCDLVDEIARQARDVIHLADEDDRVALLEGVITIEVGSQHLVTEVTRAAGELPTGVSL